MKESEMQGIMSYIAADTGALVTDDMRLLWLDQFQHEEHKELMTAARLLIARKRFDRFPRCADMWEALSELRSTGENWSISWERWVKLSRKYGCYAVHDATFTFAAEDPLGAKAMSGMEREYFQTETKDMPTFRAQFRQRYEQLREGIKSQTVRPKDLMNLEHPLVHLLNSTIKLITNKER